MEPLARILPKIADAISKGSSQTTSNTNDHSSGHPNRGVGLSRRRSAGLGDPDCPVCGGVGFIKYNVPVEHPHFGRIFPCECRQNEMATRKLESLRSFSNLDAFSRMIFDSFLPEGHGLNNEKRLNLQRAFERAYEYAKDATGWLLIRGGYGCGKTHLAAAIANYRLERAQPALFINVPDLLDHLRAAFVPGVEDSYDARFEVIRTTPLLILDDLGTENATSWAQEKLYQLLNYRYVARLPTVITTNGDLEHLEPRLRSRLVDPDIVTIVVIQAPDFRQAGVGAEQSELSSLSYHGDQTFESLLPRPDLTAEEQSNLEKAKTTAMTFAENPQNWLVFTGMYGCGKTHLAAAIANYRMQRGYPALFVVVPDLLDHLRSTFGPQSIVSYDKRFSEIRNAPLLILDDLGTENATPWAREKLFQIMNHRYNARMPTVITTATPIEQLDARIQTRVLDKTRCVIFGVVVPSYRGEPGSRPRRTGTRGKKTRLQL